MDSSIKDILKDRKIEVVRGKKTVPHQRLFFEIATYCGDILGSKWEGAWRKMCKKNYAFIEGKFVDFKNKSVRSSRYFWRIINPKK